MRGYLYYRKLGLGKASHWLRSNYITGTFKHSASIVFNSLPNFIRSSETKHQFLISCKSYFMAKASDRVTV